VQLSDLGPFFALQEKDAAGPWLPLRSLYDEQVLEARVGYVAGFLQRLAGAEVEPRVAASTMSLGLFARLLAPTLGSVVLERPLAPLSLDDTFWQPSEGGPWPLAITGVEAGADPKRALGEVILPLAEFIGQRYSLSAKILRGNVASGVFGAVRMVGQARPDLAETAHQVGQSLLSDQLHGTGVADPEFRRTSCCLYYRIPGGGYCGDCVLGQSK